MLAVLMPVFSSCSVKDTRDDCPCWLKLDLDNSQIPPEGGDGYEFRVSFWNGEEKLPLWNGGRVSHENYPEYYEHPVKRGHHDVCCAFGIDRCYFDGLKLSTMPASGSSSEGFDALWAYDHTLHDGKTETVDCTGETAEDKIKLHKQFANLKILVTRVGEQDYNIAIKGNVEAINVRDLATPVLGPDLSHLDPYSPKGPKRSSYTYNLSYNTEDTYSVRIPRHDPDNAQIRVEIFEGTSVINFRTGKDIGALIKDSGYDWTATDLADIYLVVQFSQLDVDIIIKDWEHGDNEGNLII